MGIAVIGSGLAGTAAAFALQGSERDVVVYERSPYAGGHTHSTTLGGVTVDEGPHVSFTKDERIRRLFAASAGEVEEISARVSNYFQGSWITHPAQVHLHGLDPDLVTRCLVDVAAERAAPRQVDNYGDWLRSMYGSTFAETFPYRYTRKYWTVEPEELGVDWVGQRMYRPSLQEMVRGAVGPGQEGAFHYVSTFRYPSHGGYQSFARLLAQDLTIETGKEVVEVDSSRRNLRFADGSAAEYDELVSSMPLDQLVQRMPDAPDDVREAAERLLCTSVVLVDVTLDRADVLDVDWFYVYDEDIEISRVHFPHHLSPHNAPPGVGAIQAEVYFSAAKPLTKSLEQVGRETVDAFVRMGLLRDAREVTNLSVRLLPYANVVFTHDREPARQVILPWVRSRGIHLAGRFGLWDYSWTDDAVRAGWQAAADVLGRPVDDVLDDVLDSALTGAVLR